MKKTSYNRLLKACIIAEDAFNCLERFYPQNCTGKTLEAHKLLLKAIIKAKKIN